MPWVNPVLVVYGLLLIGLGAYGYSVTGSAVSLIAGGVAGLLILASVALSAKMPRVARIGAAVVALLLAIQMGPKAIREGAWHTTTIAVSSVIVVILLLAAHFMARSRSSSAKA